MPVESVTYISDLVATNPIGATDPKSQGDDHIRNIKAAIKATFPNVSGAVNFTHTVANYLVGVTSAIQTQLDAKAAANALNASNLTSGTVPDARFPATLPAISGANLTNLDATDLTGTIADARLSANVPLINASNTFTGATQTIAANAALMYVKSANTSGGWLQWATSDTVRGYFGNGTLITGGSPTVADIALRAVAGGLFFSGDNGTTRHFSLSSSGVVTTPKASASEVGYAGIPEVSIGGNVTLDAALHCGKTLIVTSSAVITAPGTIQGFACTIVNNCGSNITIVESGGSVIYLAGSGFGSHGTRTIAHSGLAAVQTFGAAGAIVVSGVGVS